MKHVYSSAPNKLIVKAFMNHAALICISCSVAKANSKTRFHYGPLIPLILSNTPGQYVYCQCSTEGYYSIEKAVPSAIAL